MLLNLLTLFHRIHFDLDIKKQTNSEDAALNCACQRLTRVAQRTPRAFRDRALLPLRGSSGIIFEQNEVKMAPIIVSEEVLFYGGCVKDALSCGTGAKGRRGYRLRRKLEEA